jgi:L-2-hydroxycarboxylate dehydrogenase (NAD+)
MDARERFDAGALRDFTAAVFRHYGMPGDDAALGAEVLIDADLAGIESHGIAHLPWHPGYAPGLRVGTINPRPLLKAVRESASTATWDGDAGLGVMVAARAMQACMEKAESSGIGMIALRNGRHFGAAGYYARMAAERDMVGMAMCNVPAIAAPARGIERVFGTNPIAMAAPVEGSHAFLLDIATTAVAGGKLEIAMRQGKPIPPGWAIDAAGDDSADAFALRKGGALLPLGSRTETSSHKGYGLGLMVDILTGILPGMGSALFIPRGQPDQGQWFAAWRIDAFTEVAEFKANMRRMCERIRASKPVPGGPPVLIPGDPEAAARKERTAAGIPLDQETIDQLKTLSAETDVPFPSPFQYVSRG